MKNKTSIFLLTVALVLTACIPSVESPNRTGAGDSNAPSNEIRVFADVALQDALTEIGKAYEAGHPGSTVKLSFSNSRHLRELIEQGKVVDLFVSGIPSETADLVKKGYIEKADSMKFATRQVEADSVRHYDISVLANSKKHDQAADFMNYVLSPEGLGVLIKWGFITEQQK